MAACEIVSSRSVVSSFIFQSLSPTSQEPPQVALFKRSSRVRTYQHKLAPISGSIESQDASPVETAWRELQEETTLTRQSLRLRRQGKPYSFVDEGLQREWTIYPFAFDLVRPEDGREDIQIDWEHESWSWVDPRSVTDDDTFGGVPNLAKSLRRVWFEYDLGELPGKTLAAGLDALRQDHESGAQVLAGTALTVLRNVVLELRVEKPEEWWEHVRMAAWHVWKNGREAMGAAILHSLVLCLGKLEAAIVPDWYKLSPDGLTDEIRAVFAQSASSRSHVYSAISQGFQDYLASVFGADAAIRILTLSSSSTISRCLKEILSTGTHSLDVRILESRPLFEGAAMAADVASSIRTGHGSAASQPRHQLTVYTDACAGIASRNVDVVLLGADLISAQGDVCNKTGSLPAVLAAKHVSPGVKVAVMADSQKVFPYMPPAQEENDETEIRGTWATVHDAGVSGHTSVAVKNVYFEWVPCNLIDVYLTESGRHTTTDIEQSAERIREKASHMFDGL